jgi:alpha-glucosidase
MSALKWWQKAVFYQIYPRSFADSNGDGIGDLQGIIDRLGYLKDLGIDGIWLSPQYPSPQFDCGYDIADYSGVAPEYGTLDDFKRFLVSSHQLGIRVILDLVLNHTSNLHPWFIESRSSRDNPKHDWYVWRDGKDGGLPNNWYASFGGSAWEYDSVRGQYYYHFFFKEQPDLNWRNPQVKQAMFDAMRFWLDMGVDGFRLDAIGTVFEDPKMPDHDAELTLEQLMALGYTTMDDQQEYFWEQWRKLYKYQTDLPEMQDLLREVRSVVGEYDDRVLVGETDEIIYNADDQLHMVFNFPLMRTKRLTPAWVRKNQEERLAGLKKVSKDPDGAWPCNTLGNHDSARIYSYFGTGVEISSQNDALARLHLALLLTLRGTPFLYNGEEIGMTDYLITDITQFKDNMGVWIYRMVTELIGIPPEQAVLPAAQYSRDKCRTPLQWRNAPNAGFSPAHIQPWLPVNPNYQQGINVEDQEKDPGSMLNFYRRLIHLRSQVPALIEGTYAPLRTGPQQDNEVLSFLRSTRHQVCLVVLNLSGKSHSLNFERISTNPISPGSSTKLIFSNYKRKKVDNRLERLRVKPFEIYIGEVHPA